MRCKFHSILILFLCTPLLSSCWSNQELNDISVVAGIGIDKKDNVYHLSAQIVNPNEVSTKEGTSSGLSPVFLTEATGSTIYEALRKISLGNSRKAYISHLRVLVISEDFAKEGLSDELDFMYRDYSLRTDFLVIIAKNVSAKDTLKVLMSLEKVPAEKLFQSLIMSEKMLSSTKAVTIDEFMEHMVNEGNNPVLSGIELLGNPELGNKRQNSEAIESPTKLKYAGLAVFNGGKLVGWLDDKESIGYNYITNHVKRTIENIPCPNEDKEFALDVIRTSTRIQATVDKIGTPHIKVKPRLEVNIGEFSCSFDLTEPETITKLEKLAEQTLKNSLHLTVKKVQEEYNSDIFGFGQALYRSEPQTWKKLKEDWPNHFANLDVDITPKVNIRQLGLIKKPISK
ncbi:Ger(x)C family spore germination protein [Bacillus sp. FJAT-50079]|uniref:Ger(x)C family spore germination protein n=1 Tax=Bacillus sp. FJAT-50079 TaxID=2833577 RepID=UPI001BC9C7EE|nr:Ger(x)C family spore germination protein [Bacillus sp. FJAT-50079]MBS4210004.1 Ger(x)C family spore germination protein [Bacillus sp. FJAT-50079]